MNKWTFVEHTPMCVGIALFNSMTGQRNVAQYTKNCRPIHKNAGKLGDKARGKSTGRPEIIDIVNVKC